MKEKTVMLFGVFDFLHPGHKSVFTEARKHGGHVIAVVARDAAVFALKGKKPYYNERARVRLVRDSKAVSRAVLGDVRQGTYSAIRKYSPEVICLGYDQDGLMQDLKDRIKKGLLPKMKIVRAGAHHPYKYRSSILRKKHTKK